MNTNAKIFLSIILLLVAGVVLTVVLGVGPGRVGEQGPGKHDGLASCIKDSGAVFYGAWWCSHCRDQKKLFGASEKLLPYVECSTPDGKGSTAVCREKDIGTYPTWEFADGSRIEKVASLETLAERTSCALDESAYMVPAPVPVPAE
ncbi:MAG: hypothetical protein M3M85_04515 [bacterium]|nr:hypothetical protein [bacterium]